MQVKEFSIEVGGKPLVAQFTDLANQAHGSVILRYGNTAVLATAVMSEHEREGLDYFPLTVEYEEKFYAAGSILGSRFMRREGRPSEDAILAGRVTDRTIRPLFDSHIRNEVQVIITVLSIDEDDPDVLGINAASLALLTSSIPWSGPVSAVRISRNGTDAEGVFAVNASYAKRKATEAELEMIVCGKDGMVNMIETGAHEASEGTLTAAMTKAVEEIERLQEWQKRIAQEIGKEKRVMPAPHIPTELSTLFEEFAGPRLDAAVFSGAGKQGMYELKREWAAVVSEKLPEASGIASDYFEEQVDKLLHREAIERDRRADGRKLDEIRPLFAQAGGVSPIIHGSGIFYRGATHVFSALTLGGPEDSLLIDSIEEPEFKKRFMHHYNFPPFSSGETGRIGGLNRRMIGHGALAEKALAPLIPPKEAFPYTIRLVSECLASNGSTSMASVCASSLALMDGGVPIPRHVAGISIGLMMETPERYKLLTDIQGPEDSHGDMDFKVAGTIMGVTAIQMDVKVSGVPVSILAEALGRAKTAREEILKVLESSIPSARADISPRAPKIVVLSVKPSQIGLVIGPGGKTINGIKEATGVEDITIEDDGTVFITGKNGTAELARAQIEELTHEYTKGERYEGEVTRMLDFGAFVRIGKNAEGLVHISEIAPFRIEKITDVLSIGQKVPVIIKGIDEKERINLSIKEADPNFAANQSSSGK